MFVTVVCLLFLLDRFTYWCKKGVSRCHLKEKDKKQTTNKHKNTLACSDLAENHIILKSSSMSFCLVFSLQSSDDTVYLDQEISREEYVLNDSGLIWMGTAKKHCGMPWNFGQVS